MKRFREAVRSRDRTLNAYYNRLEALAGAIGVDENGLQLDRREFHSTKEHLTNIYFMQLGWDRNCGAYRADLLDFIGEVVTGLPAQNGTQLVARRDRKAWRAWRKTPCGLYFGVGGTSQREHQWQYDGPTAPPGFPSDKSRGWINATLSPSSIEWAKNDEPPTSVE